MIIRQLQPVNLEFPFDRLNSFVTPNEWFYVRSHFAAPALDVRSYKLRIRGAVTTPLGFSYDDLRSFPAVKQVATLECAGNGRIFLVPQAEGARWQLGAVGTAEWTGVPLQRLLDKAGLLDSAVEIVFEGADRGKPTEKPCPAHEIPYARSLSRAQAVSPEVLVAYQMNGQDLPLNHGFPVRLIVPGHYGMASVKWLTDIHVVDVPFQVYWQTTDYAFWDELHGMPVRRPLAEMKLKSQIARPAMYEAVRAGEPYLISGAAWCGDGGVVEVNVSTDGGGQWRPAEFLDPPQRFAWRRWQMEWRVPGQLGPVTLLSRAVGIGGDLQPMEHDPKYGNYCIHHALPIQALIV